MPICCEVSERERTRESQYESARWMDERTQRRVRERGEERSAETHLLLVVELCAQHHEGAVSSLR